MKFVVAAVTYFFIFLLGLLPFRLLYGFSDFAGFVLKFLVGYRRAVIEKNLKMCFPEKDQREIRKLTSAVYKNLADVMVEGLKAFTMSRRQLKRRHKILNPGLLDKYKGSGKNIIAAPGHYGNWEWGTLSSALQLDFNMVAFYTPLSNPYLDKRIRKNRSRTGTTLVSTRLTGPTFDSLENSGTVFVMAADQSPSKPDNAIWVDFMGQKTAFLWGIEKHARNRNLPVLFVDIQRTKRGFYTLELSMITEDPVSSKPGEITAAYARKVENVIQQKPEDWLWSHKRWKLNQR